MRCSLSVLVPVIATIVAISASVFSVAQSPTYNLGRTPTEEEIRAAGISIGPDGKDLPPGSGSAKEGAKVYAQRCAACHGPTGAEGEVSAKGRRAAPPLVGGKGTLTSPKPIRTIGSFWPYATTIWDYVNRAMPLFAEGSLSADEVYAVTAFLLYQNGIIQESEVLDAKTLPKVQMPNWNGFVPSRPEWKAPPRDRSRNP